MEMKISSPINQDTRPASGANFNLMGSDNASEDSENEGAEDDAPQEPSHANVTPSAEPPQYWTDYLAMEEQRYNQRVQWEQQMASQFFVVMPSCLRT
ncbi:hypothetical protein LOK49_LG14G01984 [Camellia lanceoleosa]|uniref:Uncharacterized protein n=1 Tax=Camellia lanceoleosa TaxID=1840588 RepID=A0ACC0FC39_9ERIC|nr:hypothetical protein LOK49_LG14G01984 [Camellia lanceoleosa]